MRHPGLSKQRGYALIDVVLAITIFAIAATGMLVLLNRVADTSNEFRRDKMIQGRLKAYITEAQAKPVREIPFEHYDQDLDVTFSIDVEPLELSNAEGKGLDDLYKIITTAAYVDAWGEQLREAEVYIYQTERK